MSKIKTNCSVCGKEIYRWPYQIQRFDVCCDAKCRAALMKGRISSTRANLINERFGMLTVLEFAGVRKGHAIWKCLCDCGAEAIVSTGALRNGHVKSCGCLKYRSGANHPNYRKGYNITPFGYKEIPKDGSKDSHRYKSEHRTVMEEKLGRPLRPDEVIHHINLDKLDNRSENLVVMTRAEHASLHAKIRRGERHAC